MSINMQERISKKRIIEFLMEAQSHSGLPFLNPLITKHLNLISSIPVDEDVQEDFLNEMLSYYMIDVHNIKHNWKSYDW